MQRMFTFIFDINLCDLRYSFIDFSFLSLNILYERIHYAPRTWVSNQFGMSLRKSLQHTSPNLVLLFQTPQHSYNIHAEAPNTSNKITLNLAHFISSWKRLGTISCACMETWSIVTKTLQLLSSKEPRYGKKSNNTLGPKMSMTCCQGTLEPKVFRTAYHSHRMIDLCIMKKH